MSDVLFEFYRKLQSPNASVDIGEEVTQRN